MKIDERPAPSVLQDRPRLYVDGRLEKPYHCDVCGDSYEACDHWQNGFLKDPIGEFKGLLAMTELPK